MGTPVNGVVLTDRVPQDDRLIDRVIARKPIVEPHRLMAVRPLTSGDPIPAVPIPLRVSHPRGRPALLRGHRVTSTHDHEPGSVLRTRRDGTFVHGASAPSVEDVSRTLGDHSRTTTRGDGLELTNRSLVVAHSLV